MTTPNRTSFDVLNWIVSREVHGYLDVAGRPVGEGRSAAIQEVKTEMRTCPYSGSRYHHEKPMNASAIQNMPAWSELLGIMSWLSHRHRQRYGTGVTNSNDLARITSAGIMLVDYLALRRDDPVGAHSVPLLVSGVYKVCLGYQLAYLPERFAEDGVPAELPDAEGFLAYLEEAALLIGEAEVCSCPPHLILQSYEAMTRGSEGVLEPQLRDLVIDWKRFDDFAEAAGDMWRELVMFALRPATLVPQLEDDTLPSTVRERLNRLLAERGSQLLAERDGLVVVVAESVRSITGTVHAPLPVSDLGDGKILPGSLAATVLEWLRREAPDEIASQGVRVAAALQKQLGGYETYEAAVLARINASLDIVMEALGLEAGPSLTNDALTRLCGPTLRSW